MEALDSGGEWAVSNGARLVHGSDTLSGARSAKHSGLAGGRSRRRRSELEGGIVYVGGVAGSTFHFAFATTPFALRRNPGGESGPGLVSGLCGGGTAKARAAACGRRSTLANSFHQAAHRPGGRAPQPVARSAR